VALVAPAIHALGQQQQAPEAKANALTAQVGEVRGQVTRFDPAQGAFLPAAPGFVVDRPTLFVVAADSSLVFSCVGGIAGRVSENSRIVLAPAVDGAYEADLRKGTIAMLLDPDRPEGGPSFAVRTAQGVTSATGTFFAVTEYKGQTYTKVKRGAVKRKVLQPTQRDFAAYLNKSKPALRPQPRPNPQLRPALRPQPRPKPPLRPQPRPKPPLRPQPR
ncbi:uncharacterized protein METZ01_LOCUS474947, partial [marine metagenome]